MSDTPPKDPNADPADPPLVDPDKPPADQIGRVNALLAEWAARNAADSDALIERFESMGYAVRGKSEEEIAQVLKQAPQRKPVA
ncbi:hypothetical protein [Methylobacterium durans]|uniref:Uncharacterized protein n=1 Tax=Methylobacterium durans TaxID=2202825 RepID=A0A2U8W5E8_9HYPH|nr:hypothetical protein [Methylobacterium durans]AWN40861.1 hypothetical protein DK389_10390 [Methylobacterium durans]